MVQWRGRDPDQMQLVVAQILGHGGWAAGRASGLVPWDISALGFSHVRSAHGCRADIEFSSDVGTQWARKCS